MEMKELRQLLGKVETVICLALNADDGHWNDQVRAGVLRVLREVREALCQLREEEGSCDISAH